MKAYILNSASVSPQQTFEGNSGEWMAQEGHFLHAIDPNYREYIPPALIRRMSKVIKMSLACTHKVLDATSKDKLQAISVGTGLGCLRDSERFLMQVCQNETGVMSPTSFIQSTHNTIAGQIALLGEHRCYNMTYSNVGHSFENAIEDSLMQIAEGYENVLVGGADELTPFVESLHDALNCHGENRDIGEGAAFFRLGSNPAPGAILLEDMCTFELENPNGVLEKLNAFLAKNDLQFSDIDGFALGCSTKWKSDTDKILLDQLETNQTAIAFKELSGEFHTASAIGLELATKWLKNGRTYSECVLNENAAEAPTRVLVYNHYRGQNHAFYLLNKC